MTNTVRVNRKNFIKNYRTAKKQRGLSTIKVAKNAHLTPSYTYHVTSPRNKRPLIGKTVLKIGRGLGMKHDEALHWLKSILAHGDNFKPQAYSLDKIIAVAMKQHRLSPRKLSDMSGLDVGYIKKLLDAKKLVKTSKMDLARLANSLKMNVKTLERAKDISLDKYNNSKRTNRVPQNKHKSDDRVRNKDSSLLKFLKKRDKQDRKHRAKHASKGNVTQHVSTGNVSIGNSKNPFSLNENRTQNQDVERTNPFLQNNHLNVKMLATTASELNDMDVSILNMIAQRLLQAEYRNK